MLLFPALTDEQALSSVAWLAAADLPPGDPRMADEALCRRLAGNRRCFASWPDGALGFLLSPRPAPANLVVSVYRLARVRLEILENRARFEANALLFLRQWQWPSQPSTVH